jgi:hypothetical protein
MPVPSFSCSPRRQHLAAELVGEWLVIVLGEVHTSPGATEGCVADRTNNELIRYGVEL